MAVLGCVLALQVAAGAPAFAHAELVSSDPADQSTVGQLPPTVQLRFSEVVGEPAAVRVIGPGGHEYQTGLVEVVDNVLRQSLLREVDAPPGGYTISYQITSADGHPITGTLRFSLSNGGPSVPASTPAADQTPTAATGDSGVDTGVVIGLVVGLVVALGLVLLAIRRLLGREQDG